MSELHELNESNFNATVLEEKRLVLIDFWSPTCGPCRMLAPVLETLAKENASVVFLKCNVFENMNLASQLNISVVPTLIFYKKVILFCASPEFKNNPNCRKSSTPISRARTIFRKQR